MRHAWRIVVLGLVATWSFAGIDVNSERGEQVFLTQGCPTCHTVHGEPQKAAPNAAPDIIRRLDRNYTAASMASEFWNHAPQMWEAAKKNPTLKLELSEPDVADLFSFFYTARFFENLGDGGRGKGLFTQKCAKCHALVGDGVPGNPVPDWASLADPVDLVRRAWLHAGDIVRALDNRREKWSRLDSQEMTDLLVYLQNLPATRSRESHLELPTGEKGAELISQKGCVDCHKGPMALENRLGKTHAHRGRDSNVELRPEDHESDSRNDCQRDARDHFVRLEPAVLLPSGRRAPWSTCISSEMQLLPRGFWICT